ncbi:MAG: transcriptional regulator [Clostridia bacterium]|nr:transcriptional regulator [Clostridia bacterium]
MRVKVKHIFQILFLIIVAGLMLYGLYCEWSAWYNNSDRKKASGFVQVRPPSDVAAIVIKDNIVWAGGANGVYRIDRNTCSTIGRFGKEGEYAYTRALLADSAGKLWIGHERGLTCVHKDTVKTYTKADGLPDDRIQCLMLAADGGIWGGTWEGAFLIKHDEIKTMSVRDGLLCNMVNVILEDKEGGLWFGSYDAPRGGISVLKNGVWQYFNTQNGLPHNNVTSMICDEEGGVWAGTGLFDRGGAVRFKRSGDKLEIAAVLEKKDGLAGEKVRSVFIDSRGNLWFGSEYDGIALFGKKGKRVFTTKDGLTDNEVKCIAKDQEGYLWMGTRDGVTRMSGRLGE